jgi:hypothetical protein
MGGSGAEGTARGVALLQEEEMIAQTWTRCPRRSITQVTALLGILWAGPLAFAQAGAQAPVVQIRDGARRMCLDVPGGARKSGTAVQLWECSRDNPNQRWEILASGLIRWSGTEMCLSAPTPAPNGVPAQIRDCNPKSPSQRWERTTIGGLRAGGATNCLFAPYYIGRTSVPSDFQTCDRATSFKWSFVPLVPEPAAGVICRSGRLDAALSAVNQLLFSGGLDVGVTGVRPGSRAMGLPLLDTWVGDLEGLLRLRPPLSASQLTVIPDAQGGPGTYHVCVVVSGVREER